jgi:hypothetical protein
MEVLFLHLHALLFAYIFGSNLGWASLCEMFDILLNWHITRSTSEGEKILEKFTEVPGSIVHISRWNFAILGATVHNV